MQAAHTTHIDSKPVRCLTQAAGSVAEPSQAAAPDDLCHGTTQTCQGNLACRQILSTVSRGMASLWVWVGSHLISGQARS
jgi:hypothetical protein